jgi:hypothetical protein
MKKLSLLLISVSLVFLLSVNTSGGNSTSQLELSSTDSQASHPIQPPVY